nr:retrovirus-related Pol polyprotein from transposon TNT 1-94 [Tanacetum cinerariifolium]
MKAKLALLKASPSSPQNPKTFQPKNKGLVTEIFDWDEEEVSDKEEVTHVKVLIALADDELTVRKNHTHNGEWVDITMRKVNTLLSMDEDADWQNYLKERIPDISYFYVFGCLVFIHNRKDHLGKFDAKADDGYFLGCSSILKDFKIYNTRRQKIKETYHVTFNESMEAIRFTNTLVDEIGIDDSSRYPPDKFQEDDPSR